MNDKKKACFGMIRMKKTTGSRIQKGIFLVFCVAMVVLGIKAGKPDKPVEAGTISCVAYLGWDREKFPAEVGALRGMWTPYEARSWGYQLINENFSENRDNFGFAAGAAVLGGRLYTTVGMEDCETSVKRFDTNISHQSRIEVGFDWTTNVKPEGTGENRSGIEFRDMYGRLLFAVSGGTGLGCAVTGYDSDSSQCSEDWEPKWSEVTLDSSKVYKVRFTADFEKKVISYAVAEKDGTAVIQEKDVPTSATGLFRMVACNYNTNGGTGTQIVDNFKVTGAAEQIDLPLQGKTVYAFGDSVVDGYKYPEAGFVEFVAEQEGMKLLHNGAVNGATFVKTSGQSQILEQVLAAPEEQPDYVIFNGGVNEAYARADWGMISTGTSLNKNTVAGAFEHTISQMQQKWPDAKLIYVTTYKIAHDRPAQYQQVVYDITMEACRKWGVTVADLYSSELNMREVENRMQYGFDELGPDGLPEKRNTLVNDASGEDIPNGVHLNFLAIEDYCVPVVSSVLRNIEAGYSFTDVYESDWFFDAVYSNYQASLMDGLTETSFGPLEMITRAQLTEVFYRLDGSPEVEYRSVFTDIPEGKRYTDAILWGQEHGIVSGYQGTGMFRPNDQVLREQIAIMLYRYAVYKGYDTSMAADLSVFEDTAEVSYFAEESVAWAVGMGIVTGKNGNTVLAPQSPATRAECAAMIQKFVEIYRV